MFENLLLHRLCSPLVPVYWLIVPIAFCLAMAVGLTIRSLFDVLHPAGIGDYAQADRNALVWMFIAGFASVIWAGLAFLAWSGGARPSLKLVPLLIGSIGAAGVVLAARSALRAHIINASRATYQDDVDTGWPMGPRLRNLAPADTLGLWIGALMVLAALALWRAAYSEPGGPVGSPAGGFTDQWC